MICGRRVLVNDTPYSIDDSNLWGALAGIATPFAVKPYGGGHGEGFDIIERLDTDGKRVVFRGRGVCGLNEWLAAAARDPQGLIFQELLAPHPSLCSFGSSALNTLRIATVRDADGISHPVAILFKLARVGALVDNIGAGALASHVDPLSGRLSKAFSWPGDGTWDKHPDTGAQIEGYELPYWSEAVALAVRAHERLTSAGSLSWDVAITERGPMLLEMNAFAPRPVYQRLDRGLLGTVCADVLRQRGIVVGTKRTRGWLSALSVNRGKDVL